jgi:hypothetical protein
MLDAPVPTSAEGPSALPRMVAEEVLACCDGRVNVCSLPDVTLENLSAAPRAARPRSCHASRALEVTPPPVPVPASDAAPVDVDPAGAVPAAAAACLALREFLFPNEILRARAARFPKPDPELPAVPFRFVPALPLKGGCAPLLPPASGLAFLEPVSLWPLLLVGAEVATVLEAEVPTFFPEKPEEFALALAVSDEPAGESLADDE